MLTWDSRRRDIAKACVETGIILRFGDVRTVGGRFCGFSKGNVQVWKIRNDWAAFDEKSNIQIGGRDFMRGPVLRRGCIFLCGAKTSTSAEGDSTSVIDKFSRGWASFSRERIGRGRGLRTKARSSQDH